MKLQLLITTAALSLALTSCDDILDLNPLDKVSQNTFWKTETNFENALAACYATMQNDIFSSGQPYWDNISDNGYGQHNYGSSTDIVAGNINTNTGGLVSGVYNNSYSAIARINIFLQNLKDFTGFTDVIKKQKEAEARMLRAFYYSFLYRCYGDVPVVDEPLTLENQFQPKKPASEVLNFIIQDLNFAIDNLPDQTYGQSNGRWTKNAAIAYKARILLYDAYNAQGEAIVTLMNDIKELLTQITGYRLADKYSDNFRDAKQESCPEIMFSVKFLAPNNYTSADMWYTSWVVVSPLSNLISEYDMADGNLGQPIPINDKGAIDKSVFNNQSLTEREERAAENFFIDSYLVNGVEYTPDNPRPLGTGLFKFVSLNLEPPYFYSTYSQQDWVIIRYADVLLMLAEVENEINGPTPTVYDAINDIRKRAKTSPLPDGLNKEQMRERIRHERRIELAFEGQRYFDLKRWKIAKQVLNDVKDGLVTYKFEDKHYRWPLPQTEIDKANGILVQNPDYQ